jgi:hypothetical protein
VEEYDARELADLSNISFDQIKFILIIYGIRYWGFKKNIVFFKVLSIKFIRFQKINISKSDNLNRKYLVFYNGFILFLKFLFELRRYIWEYIIFGSQILKLYYYKKLGREYVGLEVVFVF